MSIQRFFQGDSGFVVSLSEKARKIGGIDLAGSYLSDGPYQPSAELFRELDDDSIRTLIPPYGLPELREQIAMYLRSNYERAYDPSEEITITHGQTQALFACLLAFLGEDDEVIIFEPAAEYYLPIIQLCRANPVYVTLKEPDFHIDWDELTLAVNANTRMILINTPHSPTGMVMSELDMLRLQRLINGTRIIVVSDETYKDLVYDTAMHQSIAMFPKLADCGIVISSLNIGMGLMVQSGFCAAPAEMMKKIRKVLHFSDGGHFVPLQKAMTHMVPDRSRIAGLAAYYRKKKEYFVNAITERTRLTALNSLAGCFVLLDYSQVSTARDTDFANMLLEQYGIAVAPYSAFFHDKQKRNLIRINFARPNDELEKAVDILGCL